MTAAAAAPDPDASSVIGEGPSIDAREQLLVEGADGLRTGRRRVGLFADGRVLVTIAATLMTLGLCLVLVGWFGAARSTLIEEQVPYLISGGLLGAALAVIGALCLLAHWMTVLIGEQRARHSELLEALRGRPAPTREEGHANGSAGSEGPERAVRRTSRRR